MFAYFERSDQYVVYKQFDRGKIVLELHKDSASSYAMERFVMLLNKEIANAYHEGTIYGKCH